MRQKWIAGLVVVLLAVAGFVIFQPSGAIRGTIAGEAFLNGHPSSYWGQQLTGGPEQQANARTTLEESGEAAVGVLCDLLSDHPDSEVRVAAAELLGKLGPQASDASQELLAAIGDRDPHVRAVAIVAVPAVNTSPEKAVAALIPLLESEHAAIAARAISVYREQGQLALPALEKLMRDDSKEIEMRWNAARALGKLGPSGIDSLPALIEFTTHAEETLREHAAEAIGDIGPTATAGIPALRECLDDSARKVRRDAVRSLGYIGEAAKDAVPDILPLLNDPEEIVRVAALDALKKIAPDQVPPETQESEKAATPEKPSA